MLSFLPNKKYFYFSKEILILSLLALVIPIICLIAFCFFTPKALFVLLILCIINNGVLVFVLSYRIMNPLSKSLNKIKAVGNSSSSVGTTLLESVDWAEQYYENAKNKEYSTLILQKQAEIDFLQNQINPHFLYNTLDSVRGQALDEGAEQTSYMVESLSRFLRYTISLRDDMIRFEEELDSVRNYMNIQKYRFADRFDLNINLDEEDRHILHYKVPKLTLQPLIENALYHGLNEVISGGLIDISCTVTQSRLIILISDNGKGMDKYQLQEINKRLQSNFLNSQDLNEPTKQKGLALVNVNSRIKLIYGDQYGLIVYSMQNLGTQVEITLPLLENIYEA